MVDSGQATVQQIDDSIAYGPGLRWAIMGPMLTFHLAGGPGRDGAHARPLRPGTARALDPARGAGADPGAARPRGGGRRDGGRRRAPWPSSSSSATRSWSTCCCCWRGTASAMAEPAVEAEVGAPFTAYREPVRREWLDYNGHLNDASYATRVQRRPRARARAPRPERGYRESHQSSMFTVETHIRFLAECSRRPDADRLDDPRGRRRQAAAPAQRAVRRRRARRDRRESLPPRGHRPPAAALPCPDDRRTRVEAMREAHAEHAAPGALGLGVGSRP